jgi:hypothetical protein
MLFFLVRPRVSARRVISVGGMLVCWLFCVVSVSAQRSIPDDNLAYPVLVQFPDEKASGFYLTTETSTYFVTAKHVLFDPRTGQIRTGSMSLLSYSRDPKESGTNLILIDIAALARAGEIKVHPTADVVVVRIADLAKSAQENVQGARTLQLLPGVTSQASVSNGIVGVGIKVIKKYDEVLVANEVLLFGYPTSLGIPESPQLDPLRPLLRRGIVAGLNPNGKSIIVDCPSYPGNSGGLVVEVDRSAFNASINVIGVVSQFVPFEEKWINYPMGYQNINLSNSGYTIVTPMDFVLELVK